MGVGNCSICSKSHPTKSQTISYTLQRPLHYHLLSFTILRLNVDSDWMSTHISSVSTFCRCRHWDGVSDAISKVFLNLHYDKLWHYRLGDLIMSIHLIRKPWLGDTSDADVILTLSDDTSLMGLDLKRDTSPLGSLDWVIPLTSMWSQW
jgi:hypothetical protein